LDENQREKHAEKHATAIEGAIRTIVKLFSCGSLFRRPKTRMLQAQKPSKPIQELNARDEKIETEDVDPNTSATAA
jgi:hypothetical protein